MASDVSLYICITIILFLVSVNTIFLMTLTHRSPQETQCERQCDWNHEWIMSFKKRLFETGPKAKTVSTDLPDCPEVSPYLVGNISVNLTSPTLYELYQTVPNVEPGGRWRPANCTARHRVAIIIPFRDRDKHLLILLRHLHPFLQRQQLDYRIFVVEPAGQQIFNKGSVMNSGFAEAMKIYDYQCVVFHDVDMIPQTDKMVYACPQRKVRHMGVIVDKSNSYLHANHLGGVTIFKPKAYCQLNGHSNQFAGWGGEDDEMYDRVIKTVGFIRGLTEIMRYTMIKHEHDKKNPINENRWNQLLKVRKSKERWWEKDGLTTVNYVVLEKEKRRLYTWIYVKLFKPRLG